MKSYTPTEAHNLLNEFFEFFPHLGRAVIIGADLEEFNAAAEAAKVASRRPQAHRHVASWNSIWV